MNCYDCTATAQATPAVAVCAGYGAGVCMSHAIVEARFLTRVGVINRVETVDVPARLVHCQICATAAEAQARPAAHHARSRR